MSLGGKQAIRRDNRLLERRAVRWTGWLVPAVSALLAAAILAPPASGLTLKQQAAEPYQSFSGEGCSTATVAMRVPRGAFGVVDVYPPVGTTFREEALGDHAATVVDFRVARGRAVWTAVSAGAYCPPPPCDFVCDSSWWTTEFTTRIAYRLKVRLSGRRAETALRQALGRRFGMAWDYGYAKRTRCRGHEPRWRCRVQFILGDGEFTGRASVRARPRHGRAQFVISYRIRMFDTYCLAVGEKPRSRCIRVYKGTSKVFA